MSSFLAPLGKKLFEVASKQYKALVAKRLSVYGLKYEDLLVESEYVETALGRTNPAILRSREQRLKRAFDLSAKRKALPDELQTENPFDLYIEARLRLAEFEKQERELLNG